MALSYKNVVPWGRSYDEYLGMFNLNGSDLKAKILSCADGPASFNIGMKNRGQKVISTDPIYQFSKGQIAQRIHEVYPLVMDQMEKNQDKFIWSKYHSVKELGEIRMETMNLFLEDYEEGKKEGRYICAELPRLPFSDKKFDLVLSSHFLFSYSDILSEEFHVRAVDEMLRVSMEIRIFPIVNVNAERSPFVDKIKKIFTDRNKIAEEVRVGHEFQKGGNMMLRIIG